MTTAHLTWVRLHHGRLWHVQTPSRPATECGEDAPYIEGKEPEITSSPPINGWVCERCARVLADAAAEAIAAWRRDPRHRNEPTLPTLTGEEA